MYCILQCSVIGCIAFVLYVALLYYNGCTSLIDPSGSGGHCLPKNVKVEPEEEIFYEGRVVVYNTVVSPKAPHVNDKTATTDFCSFLDFLNFVSDLGYEWNLANK